MQSNNASIFWRCFFSTCASLAVFGLFAGITVCEPAQSGADLFKSKCAACHGADGAGKTPMGQRLKLRDLRSTEVQKQTDDQLTATITNGKSPMPAYGKTLSATDIHELVAYLRSIANKS